MLAKYQYMLSVPVSVMGGSNKLEGMLDMLLFSHDTETDNEDAEEFSAYSLNTLPGKYKSEEVTLYGIHDDSKYIDADFSDGVYISQAYADKFLLKPGDTITLKEKYEDDEYSFKIGGVYDYNGGLCIFMPQKELNQTFDFDDDYFSGYFSNSEITDIDSSYIGSVIDLDALTKISRQLNVSMGIDLYDKDSGLYEWRDQQALYSVNIPGGHPLSAYQPSDRDNDHGSSFQRDDAAEYFRLDCTVDRSDDLCEDVWRRVCDLWYRCTSGIQKDSSGTDG
uniref:Uncharacterized protein n=1 Tax=Glossina morsitans morsitans TaxID=37546 RepID=A0A1B0FCL7_GLOMM